MSHISIGSRKIGPGEPCFVIAEAGINHNGDPTLAAELLDAAAAAGADAFKIQTHFPEHEMLRSGATAAYVGESLFDLLTRTALSREAHVELRDRAAKKGIVFLSTPFSREAADFLESIGVPAFKTGSGELTNLPLQQHLDRHVDAGRDRSHRADRPRRGNAVCADALYVDVPDAVRARRARMHRLAARPVWRAGRLLRSHARRLHGVGRGCVGRRAVREAFHDVAIAAGSGPAGFDGAA
ncbi:MAG: hypothetical protein DMG00_23250 [Acidobacteria bacterium]|nr:MAG: hypothetical protein DMG00_23250 [Acidobacteriota bacterium]